MKKTFAVLSAAACAAAILATPASAQPRDRYHTNYAAPVAGAVVGTAVGVGLYNGWYGSSAFASSLPSTAAGAATTGFVAGVGTVALIDAATQPCAGFRAIFSPFIPGPSGCVNGQYVGEQVRYRR